MIDLPSLGRSDDTQGKRGGKHTRQRSTCEMEQSEEFFAWITVP